MNNVTQILAEPAARAKANRMLVNGLVFAQMMQFLMLPVWVSPLAPWCSIMAMPFSPMFAAFWVVIKKHMYDFFLSPIRIYPHSDVWLAIHPDMIQANGKQGWKRTSIAVS